MDDWQQFKDARFALQFKYPEVTLHGLVINKAENQQKNSVRVHFASQDSAELYFEVTKYEGLSAKEEYQRHSAVLTAIFDDVVITVLKEIRTASRRAHEYSFEWTEGIRSVILVEIAGTTYRILYDPRSPLNLQILSTLEWIHPGQGI